MSYLYRVCGSEIYFGFGVRSSECDLGSDGENLSLFDVRDCTAMCDETTSISTEKVEVEVSPSLFYRKMGQSHTAWLHTAKSTESSKFNTSKKDKYMRVALVNNETSLMMLAAFFFDGRAEFLKRKALSAADLIAVTAAIPREKRTDHDQARMQELIDHSVEAPALLAEETANVFKLLSIMMQFAGADVTCDAFRSHIDKMFKSGVGASVRLDVAMEEAHLLELNCPDSVVRQQIYGGKGRYGKVKDAEKADVEKDKKLPKKKPPKKEKWQIKCHHGKKCFGMRDKEGCPFKHTSKDLEYYKATGNAKEGYKFD